MAFADSPVYEKNVIYLGIEASSSRPPNASCDDRALGSLQEAHPGRLSPSPPRPNLPRCRSYQFGGGGATVTVTLRSPRRESGRWYSSRAPHVVRRQKHGVTHKQQNHDDGEHYQ
jgi:hypothetical protein